MPITAPGRHHSTPPKGKKQEWQRQALPGAAWALVGVQQCNRCRKQFGGAYGGHMALFNLVIPRLSHVPCAPRDVHINAHGGTCLRAQARTQPHAHGQKNTDCVICAQESNAP